MIKTDNIKFRRFAVAVAFMTLTAPIAVQANEHPDETIEGVSPHVRIISSGPGMYNNIYGEVPYMDSAGRYVIYLKLGQQGDLKTGDWQAYCDAEIWWADLEAGKTQRVEERALGMRCMAVSPDNKYFYYVGNYGSADCMDAEIKQFVRLDITTLEKHVIDLHGSELYLTSLASITADNRYLIDGVSLGDGLYSIAKVDLQTGRVDVILEGRGGIYNSHPQVDPKSGQDIMIQYDRSCIVEQGKLIRQKTGLGITLFLIDLQGQNYRPLPVGRPVTDPVQGHQCWLGRTGSILFTTIGSMKTKAEQGNIFTIRPGDAKPKAIARGYMYWHCNSSHDGRFFVADTRHGPIRAIGGQSANDPRRYIHQPVEYESLIVVGSVATGKTRILCPSKATCKKPQYTHPHPYFSPDSKWVIFNTEGDGLPKVAAARVPDGLLAELDKR
ncbi:MAG: hypothetical protein ACYTBV_19685 [Planctomycetota bacterium]